MYQALRSRKKEEMNEDTGRLIEATIETLLALRDRLNKEIAGLTKKLDDLEEGLDKVFEENDQSIERGRE